MPNPNHSSEEKQEMRNEVASFIRIGLSNYVVIDDLLEMFKSKFPSRADRSDSTNRKFIDRLATDIQNSLQMGLGDGFEIERKPKTRAKYYWRDKESKTAYLSRFSMTRARALALFFVSEYLEDVLPSSFTDQLQGDFESAKEKLVSGNFELTEIIEYKPLGIELVSKLTNDQDTLDAHINTALDAILNKQALLINTESIHEDFDGSGVISPYRLSYFDNKLRLLAYIHDTDTFKHFGFNSMSSLSICNTKHYQRKKLSDYEQQHWFTARCHKWVKKHFETVQFGQQTSFTHITADIWEIKSHITFPFHFKQKKPDNFFIANYLSKFGDSIEVIEPEFLRAEMKRRSMALASVYSDEKQAIKDDIINQSPHKIADLAISFENTQIT